MVQRSYNAFPVRVSGEEGGERRVVHSSESREGELCIEMRIRLYPDGAMSKLLVQLIKVLVANLMIRGQAASSMPCACNTVVRSWWLVLGHQTPSMQMPGDALPQVTGPFPWVSVALYSKAPATFART